MYFNTPITVFGLRSFDRRMKLCVSTTSANAEMHAKAEDKFQGKSA